MSRDTEGMDRVLRRHHEALVSLVRAPGMQALTRVAAETLEVERASVWLLDEAGSELECIDLFRRSAGEHDAGVVLHARDYPGYFAALASGRAIDAHAARFDPRTEEFRDGYLVPLGITSMLDAAVRREGRVIGVVCCEHVGEPRRWTQDEVILVGALADQAALLCAEDARRRVEREREHIRGELAYSEARYKQLLDQANDAICVTDLAGGIVELNRRGEELLGVPRSSALGRPYTDFLVPDDVAIADATFDEQARVGAIRSPTLRIQRPDGSIRWIDVSAGLVEVGTASFSLAVLRDVTDQRLMEERLQHAQKMEAVGRLAGGVAHDFNNVLAVVRLNADMLGGELSAGDPRRELVTEMQRAASRGQELVQQLLAFSRRRVVRPVVLDPNAVVTDMLRMLRRLIGEGVEIVARTRATARILADRGQIEQALVNLVVNARDAMPDGGAVTIETADRGERVLLSVSDTGMGMDAATAARVFEPFFTTKDKGRGTGLGLATVYGAVKECNGSVHVISAIGKGARFEILLPAVAEDVRPTEPLAAEDVRPLLRGTVLVAEDEDGVRNAVCAALRRAGLRVLSARDGGDALAVWRRHRADVDVVLTDVVMPVLSGPQLAAELAEAGGPRVLFMSGYLDDAPDGVTLPAGAPLLPKPFSPEDLVRAVDAALGDESGRAAR